MFNNIPDEMKVYRQWIVWRNEELQGGRPTKIPYCPHRPMLASVTDSDTWADFETAKHAFETGMYNGIGFVLTNNDPYTFIDLDNPYDLDKHGNPKYANPDEILNKQIKIHECFESYSEKSPSGKGLHIIAKGFVPSGRRRNAIEIYSSERYMTMTGQVFKPAPIVEHQEYINMLWADLGGNVQTSNNNYIADENEKYTDEKILQIAKDAANGLKFQGLLAGEWEQYYTSQSEADFSFINIIAFYTQSKEQIKRIFRASVLGQRQKAKREDYVNYMINKSFDRMIPSVDLEHLRNEMNRIIENKEWKEPEKSVKLPTKNNPYVFPPGLIGEVAQFIFDQAPYPFPEMALAASLAMVSGICGKAYNVSGTGLNNYIVLLGETGCGKEAMGMGIDKIIKEVQKTVPSVGDFIGPSEFASSQGLIKHLNGHPSFMSILGEFALFLESIIGFRANANATGLRRMFLNLYNKSGNGQTVGSIVYSDKDKNTQTLYAPAFSFLGDSTPEKYYSLLTEDLVSEGLLPRFTTIEYNGYEEEINENHDKVFPSTELIQRVSTLAANSLMLISQKQVLHLEFENEAKIIIKKYGRNCRRESKMSLGAGRKLWTRSHVKVMKLAAVVAVGINPYHPLITKDCVDWAINIVNHDTKNIIDKFESGDVGINNGDIQQTKECLRVIETLFSSKTEKYKYITDKMKENRIIPYKYLCNRLLHIKCFIDDKIGSINALKRTVQTLIDSGDIQELPPGQVQKEFDCRQRCFVYRGK